MIKTSDLRRTRFLFFALVSVALTTGCGNLVSSITSLLPSTVAKDEISGTAPALKSQSVQSASSGPTAFCASAKASLFRLGSGGAASAEPLQTVEFDPNGRYVFTGIKALGVQASGLTTANTAERYIVEASGCGAVHRRLVTGTTGQDLTFGSSLISFVLSTPESGRIADSDPAKLARLLKQLDSYRDYASAYAGLSSQPELNSLFKDVFGVSPEILRDAAPKRLEVRVPTKAREKETVELAVTAQQWRPDYPFAYLWVLNGAVIGRESNMSYIPGANDQGLKTLSVFIGQKAAGGDLDQSKPFEAQSFTLEIENNVPPTPTALSVQGPAHVNMPNLNLRLATDAALAACESFSKLALTENSELPPSQESDFSITCTNAPFQNVAYALQTGVGTKTLRLWARDASGRVSAAPSTATITNSLVSPVLALTSPLSMARVQSTVTMSGTCEASSGDVTISGGAAPLTVACNSGLFSATVALPGADGVKALTAAQTNQFGNTGSVSVSVIKDTTGPVVGLTTAAANPTSAASFTVTVAFSEPVIGFDLSKVSATNATLSNLMGSGMNFTFETTPVSQGSVTVSIPANAVQDSVGNPSSASAILSRLFDSIAPSVTLATTAPASTNASPLPFTAEFSEPVIGFSLAGIQVTNGTASSLSGSGASFAFVVTPTNQGPVSVRILSAAGQDAAGNASTVSPLISRVFDTVAPSVTISSTSADPTNAATLPMSLTFSEPVTGLTLSSIQVTNGTASSLSGSGTSYTFNVTPTAVGTVSVWVGAGAAQDLATNGSVASNTLTRAFNNVRPTVTIATTATTPTNQSPIAVTAIFSTPVTGFTASDVALTNGVVSGLSGSGSNYSFNVTPSGQGEVTIQIPADSAQDTATNGNTASNQISVVYDSVAPTLAFTSPAPGSLIGLGNQASFAFDGTCSENGRQVTIQAASVSATATCTSGTFSSSLNLTALADGPVSVSATMSDSAGNVSTPATLALSKDTVRPTATLSSTTTSSTNSSPIPISLSFSKSVTGFALSSVQVTNGTASSLSGSGTTYTFNVTPTSVGTVSVSVDASAAQDAATNTSLASNTLTRSFNNVRPTVTLATTSASPTNQSPIAVTATFSAAVTGLSASGISVTNGTVSGFTGTGSTYGFSVTPSGQGDVVIQITADQAQDSAGNGNLASNQLSVTYDTLAPTLAFSSPPAGSQIGLGNQLSFTLTGTCSENGRQVTIQAASVNATATCTNGTFSSNLNLTSLADGPVSVNATMSDAAGNVATPATLALSKDTVRPTVTLSSAASDPTNASPIPVSVTFSKPVTGFALSSVQVTNGTASTLTSSGTTYTFNVTPTASGSVSVSVNAGAAQDAATNTSLASNTLTRTFSNVRPMVTLATTSASPTNQSPIAVTATFSASVTGLTSGGIAVTNGTVSGLSGSGTSYSFNVTPAGQGDVTIQIPADSAIDSATNGNMASNQLSLIYDTVAPTLAFTSPAAGSFISLSNQSSFGVSGTCSENGRHVSIQAASVNATANCTSGTFNSTLDLSTLSDGAVSVSATMSDAAGNVSTPATLALSKNTARPTATLAGTLSSPSRTTTLDVTVGGSGVVSYRFKLGPAAALTCSDTSGYSSSTPVATKITATFASDPDGQMRLCVLGQNAAGNEQLASSATATTWKKDTVAAVFTGLALSPASPGNNTKPTLSGTSEALAVIELYALTSCMGSKVGDATALANGSFSVAPASSLGPDGLYTLSALATDLAGNTRCSTALSYTLDTTAPTVTLASTASAQTNTSPIPVTVSFSEAVTGFTAAKLSVTNATVSAFLGSGTSYSFNLTPSGQGVVSVFIASGQALDAAQNGNTASNTLSRTFDTVAPALTITTPIAGFATNQSSTTFTGNCETGLSIQLSGSGLVSPSSATCTAGNYSVAVTMTAGEGAKNITLTQTDAAGNTGSVTRAVTYDTTAPLLTQTTRAATSHSNTNTVTFGGACETGVNVVVSGTDSGSTSCTAGAWSYVTTSRTSDASRTYTFTQTDAAGNSASVSATWIRDTVAPALVWTSPAANTAAQAQINVTGTCETGLNVTFGGAGLLNSYSVSCASGTFSQTLFFSDNEGSKTITISQTDLAGNTTSVSRNMVRDNTPPNITQTLLGAVAISNQNSVTFGGACESAAGSVSISGSDTATAPCASDTWSYAVATRTSDATYSYTFSQSDTAGNVAQVSAQFIRDTVAPALNVASTNPIVSSSNSASWNGSCEAGRTITVSGAASSSISCPSGTWSYTASATTDATRVYTITQTDVAGNSTSRTLTWTRDTNVPNIQLNAGHTESKTNAANTVSWDGVCQMGLNIQVTGDHTTTLACASGTWSFTPPTQSTDALRSYVLTQTNAGLGTSATLNLSWRRDTTGPVISSMQINNGQTSTINRNVSVSLTATDVGSNITHFCLKLDSAAPAASSTCWIAVNAPVPGLTPSQSLSLSSYPFNLDPFFTTHRVYAWARDAMGNVSALSPSGTGSDGVDRAPITYVEDRAPTINWVLATNSDTPTAPLTLPQTTVSAGSTVFVKWRASDDLPLPSSSMAIEFSTDGSTWTSIVSGLSNTANGSCTPDDATSPLDDNGSGCTTVTSPVSGTLYLRLAVADSGARIAYRTANLLNSGNFLPIAGSTDTSNGAHSEQVVFDSLGSTASSNIATTTDPQSFVITDRGVLYHRNLANGIYRLDPANNRYTLYLKQGTTYASNGTVAGTTLRNITRLALDHQGRLLILADNRIFRANLELDTIEPLIGGGAQTSDNVNSALDLSLTSVTYTSGAAAQRALIAPLPDGRIFFASDQLTTNLVTNRRYRIYSPGTLPEVTSLYFGGTGHTRSNSASMSGCEFTSMAPAYDPNTGEILKWSSRLFIVNSGCDISSGAARSYFDPITRQAVGPFPAPPGTSTNDTTTSAVDLDGNIYLYSRNSNRVYRFNPTDNSWTTVLGTGTWGQCEDGTAALNCNIQPVDVFVNRAGQIYVLDLTRIRTIDSNGLVRTVFGQSTSGGDGGPALGARLGSLSSVDFADDGRIVTYDVFVQSFREISADGSLIQLIAGNGTTSPVGTFNAAATTVSAGLQGDNERFVLERATGDVIVSSAARVVRLNRSTGRWMSVIGNGSTLTPAADGVVGANINLVHIFYHSVFGINGQALTLTTATQPVVSGENIDPHIRSYNMNDSYRQSTIAGKIGTATSQTTFCAAGSPLMDCFLPYTANRNFNRGFFDSSLNSWLTIGKGQANRVVRLNLTTQQVETLVTLPRNTINWTVVRHGSGRLHHYSCDSNGALWRYVQETTTETQLPLPQGIRCVAGTNYIYDTIRNRLLFITSQNNRQGIGAYID